MIAEERRRKLLAALAKNGALSVGKASEILRVSRMTVHRDLDALAAAGMLRKVHGGAVALPHAAQANVARSFDERAPSAAPAKEAIARHLAKLLGGARTLALDASTTVFQLGFTLQPPAEGAHLFILTNGIPMFQELNRRNAGFRVALTGGEPHPRTGSLVGPLSVKSVEGLRFDYAVVSATGWMQEEGTVNDSTPEGVAVKQAFMGRASVKVLALDTSKVNFLAPYQLGRLEDFDTLVTEEGPQDVKAILKKLRREAVRA
ncbi:MAG: DeoR/GlpR transcriptional regulator [Planctomycetota bacterium]|nr:DeoR/GlpR transcriptional regulator [Planctomycetota bacterium]